MGKIGKKYRKLLELDQVLKLDRMLRNFLINYSKNKLKKKEDKPKHENINSLINMKGKIAKILL